MPKRKNIAINEGINLV